MEGAVGESRGDGWGVGSGEYDDWGLVVVVMVTEDGWLLSSLVFLKFECWGGGGGGCLKCGWVGVLSVVGCLF